MLAHPGLEQGDITQFDGMRRHVLSLLQSKSAASYASIFETEMGAFEEEKDVHETAQRHFEEDRNEFRVW
jgi:hypothetical protein